MPEGFARRRTPHDKVGGEPRAIKTPAQGGRLQSAIHPQSLYLRALHRRWAHWAASLWTSSGRFICPLDVDNYTHGENEMQVLPAIFSFFIVLYEKFANIFAVFSFTYNTATAPRYYAAPG